MTESRKWLISLIAVGPFSVALAWALDPSQLEFWAVFVSAFWWRIARAT